MSYRSRPFVRCAIVAVPCVVAAAVALWILPKDAFDLRIFLAAGQAVLHGHHPYAVTVSKLESGSAFVYPLPAAYLFAPISTLDHPRIAYDFACAAALAAGLLLLGVRRISVAIPVALSAFTLRSLTLGTVEPLLFLLLALVWRLRDRPAESGVVLGCAIVLKPVVAPVLLFMLLTGRLRAAAVTVVVALGLWIAAGGRSLHSFSTYASMLHDLSQAEARKSLSTVRLIADLRLSLGVATAIVAVVGIAVLLLAGIRAARRGGGEESDRTVFAVAVIVGVGSSPIVWSQYFLLVFLALLVVRVNLVWLYVVFAASWFITPDRVWVVSPSHYLSWPAPRHSIWLAQVVLLFAIASAIALMGTTRGRDGDYA